LIAVSNNEIKELQQKLLVALKAEWSTEYFHWKEVAAALDNLATNPAIKNRTTGISLEKGLWELESMLETPYSNIDTEIDSFLKDVHLAKFEQEGYDFNDRFWNLQSDMAFFRKNARNIQLTFLQNVHQQIPLKIF